MTDQRELYEAAVIERLKQSGFLEIEIRTECLVRCEDGYQDELINAGWHYWNAALAATPAPVPHVRVWTQKDAEREYVAFAEWFKERGYPSYPDLYPLTTENAMHSAWQEAAKRAALATTEGSTDG